MTNFSDQPDSVFFSRGRGRWFESSRAMNVAAASHAPLSWGIGIQDFDDDGFADMFVANGHVYSPPTSRGPTRATGRRTSSSGTTAKGRFRRDREPARARLRRAHVGRGAAFGDLDGDGDLDVVVVNLNERPSVLENRRPPGAASLGIVLEQPGPNREAIGALMTVTAGGRTQAREVRRNYSFLASSDVRVHFGLGKRATIDEVKVRWPDGAVETFAGVAPGRVTLKRGGGSTK